MPTRLKLIFAGTPEFAQTALAMLLDAGHEVALVLTQPDRPAGRGLKLQPSPVKELALERGIAVAQPRSLRLDGKYPEDAQAAHDAIKSIAADAMVVAAYGLILPPWTLDATPLACFNIHASLLPRWRGAAPIHRAIEAGDAETGVTIMQMDAGLDTGAMLLREAVPVRADDTTGSLHDRLASLGGRLMVRALAELPQLQPQAQPQDGVTYAHKIDKAEALIDWSQPAELLARRVRAFNPFPGASTCLGREVVKVWGANVVSGEAGQVAPGSIVSVADNAVAVATGQGLLALTALQRAGGKRLPLAEFLRGFALRPGQQLG